MATQAVPRESARAAWGSSSGRKRVILVMEQYVIEPLGVEHLAGIAREEDWDVQVFLHENFDFEPLFDEIRESKPDLVGFSIWTGAHVQSFAAADKVREMGIPVAIGGPHATYYTEDCHNHADWVVKGNGFKRLREILRGELERGVYFGDEKSAEEFPLPYRDVVYERYPHLGASPVKSMMCSIGCPFHCTYCNSPFYNEMQGGFGNVFKVRSIDRLVAEAQAVLARWPTMMFYFQDDIFGYDMAWLREFARRWPVEVGAKWHCQIRLELTRGEVGVERLRLFKEGGCTGITLAIESGDDFLRTYVLKRPMPDPMIVEGCRRIMSFGLTLRTEQILQVPFSNLSTDLSTLELNVRIAGEGEWPHMVWSSHLVPFGETDIGKIAHRFLFVREDEKDKFGSSFYWDESHLQHTETGRAIIEPVVYAIVEDEKKRTGKPARFGSPLLAMRAEPKGNHRYDIYYEGGLLQLGGPKPVCEIEYLDAVANERYNERAAFLQRIFNWAARVPEGHKLGCAFAELPDGEHSWERLGLLTDKHLETLGYGEKARAWKRQLADELGLTVDTLPPGIRENPNYFTFFEGSADFARKLVAQGTFEAAAQKELFGKLGARSRRHLFETYLYRTVPATPPIARR